MQATKKKEIDFSHFSKDLQHFVIPSIIGKKVFRFLLVFRFQQRKINYTRVQKDLLNFNIPSIEKPHVVEDLLCAIHFLFK